MQTSYTPGNLDLEHVPIYTTTDGRFNQPGTVNREVVGSADITFTSCTTMTFDYAFTTGEFAGLSGSIEEHNLAPAPGCE
jgi:hypothetical protein